jgi:hypothetical protein
MLRNITDQRVRSRSAMDVRYASSGESGCMSDVYSAKMLTEWVAHSDLPPGVPTT